MNWFLLTIISVVVVSVANILQRVLMKGDRSNPTSYATVFHFILGIFNLAFAVVMGARFSFSNESILPLLLASVFWGISTVFMFKALQLLEASEVTILSTLRIIITIIASIVFLQESFNLEKVVGTMIILAATFLVTNFKQGFKLNKGILYVLGMAVFSGLAVVADALGVSQTDPAVYNAVSNFLIVAMLLAVYPKTLKQLNHFVQPNFLKKMLPLAVFSTIQAISYLYALALGGNASQIGTIRQAQVILTVLLAVIFLKEKNNLVKKMIAAILVTIGVILLK